MGDIIDHFRERRPIVFFLIFFTLIGGVVAGIICVNKKVCDFGTAYRFSMYAGTLLTILILGYSRFAFAFRWFNDLVSESDWYDEMHLHPMILVAGAGWLILVVIVPMIEVFLLPVDILMTIILTIIDIFGALSLAKETVREEAAERAGVPVRAAKVSKPVRSKDRTDILELTDLSDSEVKVLCKIAEKFGTDTLNGMADIIHSDYLGMIIVTKGRFNIRTYFVFDMLLQHKGSLKSGFFAPYFNNLCRRDDGVIVCQGSEPRIDQLAFKSLDEIRSTLPKSCKHKSDVIGL